MCPWWALGRGCPSILTPAPGSGGQKLPYLEASSAEQVRGSWLLTQGLGNLGVHHSSKAPIHRRSTFFTVQLSHLYMTTGKTLALTRQTFVDKVISLVFNMLSRLVITSLSIQSLTKSQKLSVFACPLASSLAMKQD